MNFSALDLPENSIDYSRRIDMFREIYDSIQFESIYEPVQLREIIKGKMSVVIANHEDLIAWQKEIGYSCIVKMKNVEDSICTLFKNKDLYSVAILLRHHLEQAGLLTLSVEVIMDSLKNDDFDKLNQFISKTWYGNSFYNNPKFRDTDEAYGTIETVTISAMISSLDKFIDKFRNTSKIDFPQNVFSKKYAWLCQIAHPNSASSCFYTKTTEAINGTNIQFRWTGDYAEDVSVLSFLNCLYFSLAIGLANYFLFSSFKFSENMTVTQDEEIAKIAYYSIIKRFNE